MWGTTKSGVTIPTNGSVDTESDIVYGEPPRVSLSQEVSDDGRRKRRLATEPGESPASCLPRPVDPVERAYGG
jgi:hypothetical protein